MTRTELKETVDEYEFEIESITESNAMNKYSGNWGAISEEFLNLIVSYNGERKEILLKKGEHGTKILENLLDDYINKKRLKVRLKSKESYIFSIPRKIFGIKLPFQLDEGIIRGEIFLEGIVNVDGVDKYKFLTDRDIGFFSRGVSRYEYEQLN